MDDKVLASGSFGDGKYEIKGGLAGISAMIEYDDAASLTLVVKSKAGLEIIKKLIPGTLDDVIINVIEAALP